MNKARASPPIQNEIAIEAPDFEFMTIQDPKLLQWVAEKHKVSVHINPVQLGNGKIIITIHSKQSDRIESTKLEIKKFLKDFKSKTMTRILKNLTRDQVTTLTEVARSFQIVANEISKHPDRIVLYGYPNNVDRFLKDNDLKRSEKYTAMGVWHDIKKSIDLNVKQANTVLGKYVVHQGKIGSIQVTLEVIDITRLKVDCIVNPTNEVLIHKGGVSGAIADKAGSKLLHWSRDYIQNHKSLPFTEVAISPGFDLPTENILHVVSPSKFQHNYYKLLGMTLDKIMQTAQEKKWSSIAIPPIGSGRSGIPVPEVAELIVKSIHTLSQNKSKVEEIVITDISDDVLQVIAQKWIPNVPVYKPRTKGKQHRKTPPLRPPPPAIWIDTKSKSQSAGQERNHSQPEYDYQSINQSVGQASARYLNSNIHPGNQNGGLYFNQNQSVNTSCFFQAGKGGKELSDEQNNMNDSLAAGAASVYVTDNPRHQVTGASNIDASSTADSGTLNRNYQYLDSIGGVKNNAFNMIDSINKSFDSSNPSDICRSVRRKYPDEQNEKDGASNQQYLQSIGGLSSDNAPYVIDSINRSVDSANQAGTCTSVRRKYPDKQNEKDDICVICCDEITDKKTLPKCKHSFCRDCIEQAFVFKPACPTCNTLYGTVTGNQPEDGQMDDYKERESLPGYEGCETIVIVYSFPDGTQGSEHPSPGRHYRGIRRTCYLPDNDEGNQVLTLLKTAFDARLTFTIGRSTTTGKEGVITWNDIHHKTKKTGGPERYGYPDSEYLTRVKDELAAKGIE